MLNITAYITVRVVFLLFFFVQNFRIYNLRFYETITHTHTMTYYQSSVLVVALRQLAVDREIRRCVEKTFRTENCKIETITRLSFFFEGGGGGDITFIRK